MSTKSVLYVMVLAAATIAFAVGSSVAGEEAVLKAVAVLRPTEGNAVRGTVTFEQAVDGVKIVAGLEGLSPGKHGFHIHEYGDCSDPAGKSAGGHYNPGGAMHGSAADKVRHVGDLGNILVDTDGRSNVVMLDPLVRLSGSHSVIGRAVVVHGGEDDLHSQPSGAAGPRVACGVIGIGKD